jgi:transposase-like protein
VKCTGRKFWLWRAVDQHGTVLEKILQKRRDKGAAKRLLVTLMKRCGFVPRRIVTDRPSQAEGLTVTTPSKTISTSLIGSSLSDQ